MKTGTPHSFPSRKISETLIDFAEPVIGMIDEHTSEDQIRKGLMIAVTIWNAVVFDTARDGQRNKPWVQQIIEETRDGSPLVETLIRRKREKFGDDMRAISDYTVTYRDGELWVRAEARDPYRSKTD